MIELLLVISIAAPLAMALLLSAIPIARERDAARLTLATVSISAIASAAAVALWIAQGHGVVRTPAHVLFERRTYRFTFDLVIDPAATVFLALIQFVTGTVSRFSRFYLHREPGFRRFFATVLLFQAGMCQLALAGNLDLMFAGWEMVGLSSFLLIAFYRERRTAVRNALKTYSVYRIADVGLLLAACLEGSGHRAELGLFVLLAAMGKSAQFPFSFWITRAMEGPTPSSALFYGALSVHAGAYLLLRTFPVWGSAVVVRVAVGLAGLTTAVLCSMFSRVQTTIKGQIGYASVTQVGVILVEIALGLTHLALVHLVCNALLRCYQLLVSPSVVAHRLRQLTSAGTAREAPSPSLYERVVPGSWRPTLYTFALSEGFLKDAVKTVLWAPLRTLGGSLLPWRPILMAAVPCLLLGQLALGPARTGVSGLVLQALLVVSAVAFSACGLRLWHKPLRALAWITASNLAAALAGGVGADVSRFAMMFFAIGIGLSGSLAFAGLGTAIAGRDTGRRFVGLWTVQPRAASAALVGALGLAGFPLIPTFLGEELLVHHALVEHAWLGASLAAIFSLNGYLVVRTFAFTFFGAHEAPPTRRAASAAASLEGGTLVT